MTLTEQTKIRHAAALAELKAKFGDNVHPEDYVTLVLDNEVGRRAARGNQMTPEEETAHYAEMEQVGIAALESDLGRYKLAVWGQSTPDTV